MIARFPLIVVAASLMIAASPSLGCRIHYIGHRQYLNNAMAGHSSNDGGARVLGYASPYQSRSSITVGPTTIAHPASGSPRQREAYATGVRDELDSLARELSRTRSRAEQKGAAGLAAISPNLSDFNSARDRIDRELSASDSVSAASWNQFTSRTDLILDEARRAVRNAAADVDAVRPRPSP